MPYEMTPPSSSNSLLGMLAQPNMNPASMGPPPPPGMGAPPPAPQGNEIDRGKLILSFLMDKDPAQRDAIMQGVGFYELLKKMDLGKRQRDGAQMVNPQQSALMNSSPGGSMAAPLAGMKV